MATFGVILLAGLLLTIFACETLEAPLAVIAATLIPLSLSSELILRHQPGQGTL